MTALTRTTLSPNEKADLILRHFPALNPTYNPFEGVWEVPSMSDKDVLHTVRALQHGDQPVKRQCDCKATRTCTHEVLVERLTDGALMPGERINGRLTATASYSSKYDHLMRENYRAEGLA